MAKPHEALSDESAVSSTDASSENPASVAVIQQEVLPNSDGACLDRGLPELGSPGLRKQEKF